MTMPQRDSVGEHADTVLRELVTLLTERGYPAEYWHSGGGIMGVRVEFENGFELFFGGETESLAYDMNDSEGSHVVRYDGYATTDDFLPLRWTHTTALNALEWVMIRCERVKALTPHHKVETD